MPHTLVPLVALLLHLFDIILGFYWFVIIAAVVVSWLVAFGVLNTYNPYARGVIRALDALTEPVFRRVRRIVPPMGGLDLSPLIVLLIIYAVQYLVDAYVGMAIAASS